MVSIEVRDIVLDLSGLAPFEQRRFAQQLFNVTELAALQMVGEARQNAPFRLGNLRNAIQQQTRLEAAGAEATVGVFAGRETGAQAATDYAEVVEFGSGPHEIVPRNKKALFWEGAEHPVKRVLHPGTEARPFMRPAADVIFPRYTNAVANMVRAMGGA